MTDSLIDALPVTMRTALLFGPRDLRVESVEVPTPGAHELLVQVEACGICPTDVRKFRIGTNDGDYPLNPGHEWVGRVVAVGEQVSAYSLGERVYGDTYGGYGQFALLPTQGDDWSRGPLPVPEDMPVERLVFLEPLADCVHAVRDQAVLSAGQRLLCVGAGQMGLQMVAVAAEYGVEVVVSDLDLERRELALRMGASAAADPSQGPLTELVGEAGFDAVIVTVPLVDLVPELLPLLAVGGRLVLFAGFGDKSRVEIDLNDVHYRELTIVGSEWVGTPPRQRPESYDEAVRLLTSGGRFALETLVSGTIGLDDLAEAFDAVHQNRVLKYVLTLKENN